MSTNKQGDEPITRTNTLVVLGAPDPEMEQIERLLREHGWSYHYLGVRDPSGEPGVFAVGSDPWRYRRVTPGEAYNPDAMTHDLMRGHVAPDAGQWPLNIIAVECEARAWTVPETAWGCGGYAIGYTSVDHHRPGDPGFGKLPEEYWEASSIGQVYDLIGLSRSEEETHEIATGGWASPDPPRNLLLVAAADHCLAAAYAGECPGVDPLELFDFRVSVLAREAPGRKKRTEQEVRDSIGAACDILVSDTTGHFRPWCPPDPASDEEPPEGYQHTIDLRGLGIIPDLPEAACYLGVGYIADAPSRDGERAKVVLGGFGADSPAGTEPIEWFLKGGAESMGLHDPYGDPVRGFAGAYKSPSP